MAQIETLKQLLEVAKNSKPFEGMKEDDVWQACLAYQSRSDANVLKAMDNIKAESARMLEEEQKKQASLNANRDKLVLLHEQEREQKKTDLLDAERMMKKLFSQKN